MALSSDNSLSESAAVLMVDPHRYIVWVYVKVTNVTKNVVHREEEIRQLLLKVKNLNKTTSRSPLSYSIAGWNMDELFSSATGIKRGAGVGHWFARQWRSMLQTGHLFLGLKPLCTISLQICVKSWSKKYLGTPTSSQACIILRCERSCGEKRL